MTDSHLPDALLPGTNGPTRSPIIPGQEGIRVSRPTHDPDLIGGSGLSVTGYQAEEFVCNYYADKLFISARAISATEGIMDFSDADAHLKQAMLARAATKVLLLDSSKFGARAFSTIGGVGEIDYLITDQQPDGPLQSALEASGVEIILPRDRAQLCRADEPVQSGVASDTLETAREGDAWLRQ